MDIPEMLAANEEAVANLYRDYASRFTEYTSFWNRLVDEEIVHAAIIRKCSAEVAKGLVHLNEDRFKKETLHTYSEYIKKELAITREQRLSLIHALSTALYIEQSLIEARFFEVFEGGSDDLIKLLSQHRVNEREHLNRIRQAITQLR
jgi:hypothetical protein